MFRREFRLLRPLSPPRVEAVVDAAPALESLWGFWGLLRLEARPSAPSMETEESSRCLDRLEILKFRELLLPSSRCLWRLNAAAEPDIGANFEGGVALLFDE